MKSKFVAPLSLAGSVAALFLFQVDFVSSQQSFGADSQFRASDPSVRGGAAGAGGQIDGLSFNQQAFFASGLADFNSAEEVDEGLGPRMNLDGCGGCPPPPPGPRTHPLRADPTGPSPPKHRAPSL